MVANMLGNHDPDCSHWPLRVAASLKTVGRDESTEYRRALLA